MKSSPPVRKGDSGGSSGGPCRRFVAVATVSSEPDASILFFEVLDASDLGDRATATTKASFALALHDMVRVRGGGGAKEMIFVPDAKRGAILAVVTATRSIVFVDAWNGEVLKEEKNEKRDVAGSAGSALASGQVVLDRCWRVFNGARVSPGDGSLTWRYGSNGLALLGAPNEHLEKTRSGVEFDHEVYVMGVHPATNMLVGVTQRASVPLPRGRSPNAICAPCVSLPIFEIECHLQACAHVAIYDMIVRHLDEWEKGGADDGGASISAFGGDSKKNRNSMGYEACNGNGSYDNISSGREKLGKRVTVALLRLPECARVMELLLFSALELAFAAGCSGDNKAKRALKLTFSLLRRLPHFLSVVATLARKVEPEKWSLLFDEEACMQPKTLFLEALGNGDLSAAVSLLRILYIRGPRKRDDEHVFQQELHSYARRVEAAAGENPELVRSLRRFIV